MSTAIVCEANLVTGANGEALCLDDLGQAVAWDFEPPYQIDFSQVAEPFMTGFLLMASCWAIGHGISLFLSLVRR